MKTILVMNGVHRRSPLMEEYYTELANHFNVIRETNVFRPVEDVCSEHGIPDYLYWGFSRPNKELEDSAWFINQNQIPVIIDTGDPDLFTKDVRYTKPFWCMDTVKYVIARWPRTEGYHLEAQVLEFMQTGFEVADITKDMYGDRPGTFLKNSKLIHVPWGINPKNYPEPDYENKDIDVAYMCTIGRNFLRHGKRKDVYEILMDMKGINLRIGEFYDPHYTAILRRSKIFIVEGSGIRFLTQKYLQGAMAGCKLIGDIPFCGSGPGEPFDRQVVWGVGDWSKLKGIIRLYLGQYHPIMKQESEVCRDRVIENYSIDKVVKDLVEELN